jgi:hypothetical protein
MASVIPTKDLEAIQFFENHLVAWNESPSMIGLTALQCTNLHGLTDAARLAYSNQQAAKDTAAARTTDYHNAVKSMRALGADLVKTIKSFAATTNNPAVYGLAEIPMPAAPSPRPAPGQPTGFTISLTGSGAVELAWKSTNAAGGFFTVTRKLAGEDTFEPAGTVGKRKFTDGTIPVGTTGATYLVQGFRGNVTGEVSLPVGVQFGVAGGGGMMLAGEQLKLAA